MNVEQLEKHLKIYGGETPIYLQFWGEKDYHAIRFIKDELYYGKNKNDKPYILLIAEDDISGTNE